MASDNGKVEESFAGDLVVLATDPREYITSFARVQLTIQKAKVTYRK